jgi:hypothetical protein
MVAAFFLLRQDLDKAFVIAALGLVAWFLNYRAQMKEVIAAADLEGNSQRDEEEMDEDSDHD